MSDDKHKIADEAQNSLEKHDIAAAAADAGAPQSTETVSRPKDDHPLDAHGDPAHAQPGEEEHLVAEADRVNIGVVGLVTFVIMSGVVITVIGVYSFFGQTFRGEIDKKMNSVEDPTLREVRAMETAHLSKYQWVDQKKGIVRIPKDRAKELVLADYGKMAAYQPGAAMPAPAMSAPVMAPASAMPSGSASTAASSVPAHHDAMMPSPSTSASAPPKVPQKKK